MLKKISLFVGFFCLFLNPFFAQERYLAKGDKKYDNYSFSPAIDIYKKVMDKGYVSADLLQKLGNAYYFNANYPEAAESYKMLIDQYGSDAAPEYYFRYAQCLKSLGDYGTSKEVMDAFANLTANDRRAVAFAGEVDYMAEIEENSGRYKINDFEYNSPYSDFAPAFYKEGLIFSSDRDTGNFARYRHTWNQKDFLDLYKVDADSNSIGHVEKLQEMVNTRLHESTSALSPDGKTLYFTRNNYNDGKHVKDGEGMVRLRIFKAVWSDADNEFTELVDLPFNSDSYSVAHPALSADGKTLYFASDMPGTLGASDIFKVRVNNDGTYSTPENLGSSINTEARETFPYVTSENVLYFSSDGHPGLGGLDVFATNIAYDKFDGKVLNVGKPVNGKMDDFTFIFDEGTREGYFASNRADGVGSDDIYGFVETERLKFVCEQKITGTVRDKISNEPLIGASVKIIDENNKELTSVITNTEGKYELMLDCNQGNFVRALMNGYVPSEEYLPTSDGKPRTMDFYLEREKVTAGYGDDLAKLLQLSTIYFDFDKYNIRKDSEIEVEKVIAAMEKYPSLKIKVNSHTDSRGRDEYNMWLSKKRAESTVNYMIAKGISADRLMSEGFGESKLVNRCENGVKCSDVEHEMNRRSEFIILE
ncbi:MAG: OmpA family protein [Flavobacteriaceae bacterium]